MARDSFEFIFLQFPCREIKRETKLLYCHATVTGNIRQSIIKH